MSLLLAPFFVMLCAAFALVGRAQVRISEFIAGAQNSLRDEDGDTLDWIEIQNVSTDPASLDGWNLTDDERRPEKWRFPATNLPPGGFLVVFASGKNRQTAGPPLHTNFKLRSTGGELRLTTAKGEAASSINYPAQMAGISFGLAGDETSNPAPPEASRSSKAASLVRHSFLAKPTPGRTNAMDVSPGPQIESLRHQPFPAQPKYDEPIFVTAKITSTRDVVAEVHLRYRVMFSREVELPMHDDGHHGDGAAGDGVFGASIPAKAAQRGQMLRYCVVAKDQAGRASRWPLFSKRPNYEAYQGTVMASSIQMRLPVLDIFTPDRRNADVDESGSRAAVFYQGELHDNVAISMHGQISRGFPKPSYNVEFPRDHRFRYQTNSPRVNEIKLLTNFADKSKIRNTLAYEIIAASGSVGHFAFPVRVQRNGKFFCVAELIEDGDGRWLERVGLDPEGALYKMYDNLSSGHGGEKKTREHENSSDLARLAGALSERRPLEERATFAWDNVDLPQCVSYLVALTLISSSDHGHKNYYLYRDTRRSGEWALLPWDVDLSWGRNWTGDYFNESIFTDNPLNLSKDGQFKARNRLYNLLFQYPAFRQMYLRRLRTVMDELLQPPGTPPESLIIEKRVRELMDLLDPPEFKRSDADLDSEAWPSWGNPVSMRDEAQRIIDEYLPGRRQFLFKSGRAKLFGDPIPASQSAEGALHFGEIEFQEPVEAQFVCITNRNEFAVDVTGWRLAGAGIEHRFRPGTVVPAGKSIYAAASAAEFRRRTFGPTGGQSLFVQGNWKGRLRNGKGTLNLFDAKNRKVTSCALR